MEDTLITFETAKLAKEKGFDTYTQKVFVETLEHTLEMGRGGDCTFPYQPPRVLNSGKFDEWDIVNCSAPTQSILAKWLREVHKIDVLVSHQFSQQNNHPVIYDVCITTSINNVDSEEYCNYGYGKLVSNYEAALEFGLFEALKLI